MSTRRWLHGFAILSLLAAGAAGAETRTFANPMLGDRRVDLCLHRGRDCGKPAADAWCRSQGFTSAASFQTQNDVGRSMVIGDRRPCDDRSCDAFSAVTCERATAATASSARAQSSSGSVKRSQAVIAGAAAGQGAGVQGGATGHAGSAAQAGAPIMGDDTHARITQLQNDVSDLYAQLAALRAEQKQLADSVQFLRQNAVRPMCSQDGTAAVHPVTGAKDFCKPYECNQAEGTCRKQCSLTSECAPEHVCDRPYCKHQSEFQ